MVKHWYGSRLLHTMDSVLFVVWQCYRFSFFVYEIVYGGKPYEAPPSVLF